MPNPKPPQRSTLRRIVAFFDPGEPDFMRRAVRFAAVVALVIGCGACGLTLTLGQQPTVRYFAAAMLMESHNYGIAERITRDLVNDKAHARAAYYDLLATIYRRTGRQTEQLAVWDALVAAYPDSFGAHSQRCWYGALFGDPQRVMDSCDTAVARAPERNGLPLARRGFARIRLDDRAGAIQDLQTALDRWAVNQEDLPQRNMLSSRQHWLDVLRQGGNPIDAATLERERRRF